MSADAWVAFLKARLDEDEARAHRVQAALDAGWNYFDETPTELIDPARVLREVAAKRAILAEHRPVRARNIDSSDCGRCHSSTLRHVVLVGWPCLTVRALAAVYSDHPDYAKLPAT